MAKAGDEYMEIVGAVAKALDPGASVKTGQWMEGPDGRRDLDVEVRGIIEGQPCFVLIECKDWADPVGIGVVDALDSKRRDVAADRAVIYSNSGFTAPAKRKATRVGIGLASALKGGDARIRVMVEKTLVAKSLSVDRWHFTLYPQEGLALGLPEDLSPDEMQREILCDGLPMVNWLCELSYRLLREHEDAKQITYACTFRPHPGWSFRGQQLSIAALQLTLACSKTWVEQTVREDVSLGLYDHIREAVVVPDQQRYAVGSIDAGAWTETDAKWDEKDPEPGSFALCLTLYNPVKPIGDKVAPRVDALIGEQEVQLPFST